MSPREATVVGTRRSRFTVRRMMAAVAVVAVVLWAWDAARMGARSTSYRRKADWCARMASRCRTIVAMDPATLAREAEAGFDDPYTNNPAWSREMIPYLEGLRDKYADAAEHPRNPVAPDPPNP